MTANNLTKPPINGRFPLIVVKRTYFDKYEDGSIGLMTVQNGRITRAELLRGNPAIVDEHNKKLTSDPVTGELGEVVTSGYRPCAGGPYPGSRPSRRAPRSRSM